MQRSLVADQFSKDAVNEFIEHFRENMAGRTCHSCKFADWGAAPGSTPGFCSWVPDGSGSGALPKSVQGLRKARIEWHDYTPCARHEPEETTPPKQEEAAANSNGLVHHAAALAAAMFAAGIVDAGALPRFMFSALNLLA